MSDVIDLSLKEMDPKKRVAKSEKAQVTTLWLVKF